MKQAELRFLNHRHTHPTITMVYLVMVGSVNYKTGVCNLTLSKILEQAIYEPENRSSNKPIQLTKNQLRKILGKLEQAGMIQKLTSGDIKKGTSAEYKLTHHGEKRQEHAQEHVKTQQTRGVDGVTGTRTGTQQGHAQEHAQEHAQAQKNQGVQSQQGHAQGHAQEHIISSSTSNTLSINARGNILTTSDIGFDGDFQDIARVVGLPNEVWHETWQTFIGHHESKFTTCLKSQWIGHWRKWAATQKGYLNAKRNSSNQQPNRKPENGTATVLEYARTAGAGYTGQDF